jgi:hypothetical protein
MAGERISQRRGGTSKCSNFCSKWPEEELDFFSKPSMDPSMALIRIPEQNWLIRDPEEVRQFPAPFGISYERWSVEGRLPADATSGEITATYSGEVEALKADFPRVKALTLDLP